MSLEAEIAVLGSLLFKPELMDDLYLQPHEFDADERHALILETFQHCYEQDGTIDLVVLASRSGPDLHKIGGISYLSQLSSSVSHTHHFAHYQQAVRNAYLQRQSEQTLRTLAIASGEEGIDIKAHLNKAQAKLEELQELTKTQESTGTKRMGASLDGHVKEIESRKEKKGLTGAKTVSKVVDRMTGGHQKGDYEVVAARPSMGKTAEMVCDAIRAVGADLTAEVHDKLSASSTGYAAQIFSAEMDELKITERFICALADLDNNKMRSGMFDDDDWLKYDLARDKLDRFPIYIDDTNGMTIQHIRREVKKLVKVHPNLIVYVDYIQIIEGGRKFNSRQEEVTYVSRQLKLIARQFGVTVVALSQLSRGVEQRQDKRPMMSDLGESGAIERDADIITFLYRDDYYNKDSDKKNIVEIIIAKGRNVGIGVVDMVFLKNFGKFVDLDRSHANGKSDTRTG